jgi:hypothetical protein
LPLCSIYLKNLHRFDTFKKRTQELLKALTKFNLSWLLAFPFSGKKLTTGTWVSENWLAWIRISKIAYGFCIQRGIDDERLGGNDLLRMVTSFTALIARILSHAPSTSRTTELQEAILKEFLSSIRELDIRTRYNQMKGSGRPSSSRGDDAAEGGSHDKEMLWWLKSNYVSTLNLARTIQHIGPLINFWDGGGKGERYIQEIKPHIPRGIRDGKLFFVRLMEKVYKLDCLKKIEGSIPEKDLKTGLVLKSNCDDDDSNDYSTLSSLPSLESQLGLEVELELRMSLSEESELTEFIGHPPQHPPPPPPPPPPAPVRIVEEDDGDSNTTSILPPAEDMVESDTDDFDPWTTPMEADQMSKARTFYIYKNLQTLEMSLEQHEPITGVVSLLEDKPQFFVVYRMGRHLLNWKMVEFNDDAGVHVFGMWYAEIVLLDTELAAPANIKLLTQTAKMSAMAIPLHYCVEPKNMVDDQNKYCVITNWWRERDQDGGYCFPKLSFSYYAERSEA